MILDELVFHNFGPYRGRQTLRLAPPSKAKPVILIGGMNGVGKTSLLDAVRLALFGKLAFCAGRGGLPYDSYLEDCIHRGVSPAEGASIELSFRHPREGKECQVRLRRMWRSTGRGIRETFEVECDGELDVVLSEQWLESVDQYIPVGIAKLIFFDGEKIESLADPATSAEMLEAAIHGLLGLDLVDRLVGDLQVYENRQRSASKAVADPEGLELARQRLEQLGRERDRVVGDRAEAQNQLDGAQQSLQKVEESFARTGGSLFEQRKEIEAQLEERRRNLATVEDDLRSAAAGSAPLLLIAKWIERLRDADSMEEKAIEGVRTDAVLASRDVTLLKSLKREGVPADALKTVRRVLDADRKARRALDVPEVVLELSDGVRRRLRVLCDAELASLRQQSGVLHKRWGAAKRRFEQSERAVQGIPGEEALADVLTKRKEAQLAVERAERSLRILDEELTRTRREHEQELMRYERLCKQVETTRLETEDAVRAIRHAERVRATMSAFREALLARHSARVASLVLEGLRLLLRKERLVRDLEIDPKSFSMTLHGADGALLSPARLSAGERQLLAVALLWGLARAAGRRLPIIVDTPLGRLDSSHRAHLVERYFPAASHQVILLATDEEVTPAYWTKLKPFVGRSYVLSHDDDRGFTSVEEGYFW